MYIDRIEESVNSILDLELHVRDSRGENILHQRTIEKMAKRMQEGSEVRTYETVFVFSLFFFIENSIQQKLKEKAINFSF